MQSVFTCDMLLFIITDLQALVHALCCFALFIYLFINLAQKIIHWLEFKDAPKPLSKKWFDASLFHIGQPRRNLD